MKRLFLLLITILLIAETGSGQNDTLDKYILIGLENNLVLKQKHYSLEHSLKALSEARGLFFPNISLEARYTLAEGGRIFEMPFGDMLNPIYKGLNQLLVANGQSDLYPSDIDNEVFSFYRAKEHDTRIRIRQPVFEPALYYNLKIKQEKYRISEAEIKIYKRHLISDIKTAYYNYLKSLTLTNMLDQTKEVVNENLRVTEILHANDKITEDAIWREKSELSKLYTRIAEAEKNNKVTGSYFNFLLNRPLDEKIIEDESQEDPFTLSQLETYQALAKRGREEFYQLNSYLNAADYNIKSNKFKSSPSVFIVADYGYQGEKYSFTEKDDYMLASVVLHWDLYTGNSNKARTQKAVIEKDLIRAKEIETDQQVGLEVQDAYYTLLQQQSSLKTSTLQTEESKKSFEIVEKRYRQGLASQLEVIDARTNFINSSINKILKKYDYIISQIELERIAPTYPIY